MTALQKKNTNPNYLVSQSNQLIEAKYSMKLGEKRLIVAMVSAIRPHDKDFMEYCFKVIDLAELLGINKKNAYRDVERHLFGLQDRVVHIPEEDGYFRTHWISGIRKKADYFQVSFHPDLKPYLLQLKKKFTKYALLQTRSFQSFYTIRIYELLKQYEPIGHREFSVVELRTMLGIDDSKYSQFKDFKKWVINKAQKEFEQKDTNGMFLCDITFELETKRTGRCITHLRFIIKKQNYRESHPVLLPKPQCDAELAKDSLGYYGIQETVAQKYLDTLPESEILRCIELLEEAKQSGKTIKSASGYLITLLDCGAGKLSTAEQERLEKEKIQEQVQIQQQQRDELARLEQSFFKQARRGFIESCSLSDQAVLLEQLKQQVPDQASLITDLYSPFLNSLMKKQIPNFETQLTEYLELHYSG